MNNSINIYVEQLRGYLKGLGQFSKPRAVFGAFSLDGSNDIDVTARKIFDDWNARKKDTSIHHFQNVEIIDCDALFEEINDIVFTGFIGTERMSKKYEKHITQLVRNEINEYFGLMSTVQLSKDSWFPLMQDPIYKMNVECDADIKALYFLMKIGDSYVCTYLRCVK